MVLQTENYRTNTNADGKKVAYSTALLTIHHTGRLRSDCFRKKLGKAQGYW